MFEQRRGDRVEDRLDGPVEFADLGVEGEPASGDGDQRAFAPPVGVSGSPGRYRAATVTLRRVVSPRSWARISSGAVSHTLCSWFAAAVRAFIAPDRASRSWRSASTGPSPALGIAVASPASTARAAISASRRSDFPLPAPPVTIGLVHLDHVQSAGAQVPAQPRAQDPVPSTPSARTSPKLVTQLVRSR